MIAVAQDPPRAMVDRVGGGDYRNLLAFASDFRSLGIQPVRVLEVGCGCGRGAVLVSEVWPEAEYVGFDIDAEAVAWCQANITGAAFHHVERRNVGSPWPAESESVDFAFSVSVFTHMLPEAVAHYLRETARVLNPGGLALHTWFIVDERREQGEGIHFVPRGDGSFAADPGNPEAIMGYGFPWILEQCKAARLPMVAGRAGRWAGSNPMSMDESRLRANEYQDYTVHREFGRR